MWYVLRKGRTFTVSSCKKHGYKVLESDPSKEYLMGRIFFHAGIASHILREEGSGTMLDYILGSLKSWYRNSIRSLRLPSYSLLKAISNGIVAYQHRNDVIAICSVCKQVIRSKHGAVCSADGVVHEHCYSPVWTYGK